jgi:S1-C subfamily serine protease
VRNKLSHIFGLSNFTIIKLIICISSLSIILPASSANLTVYAENGNFNQPLSELSQPQLKQQATTITVKVLSTQFLGTGILLKRQNNIYTILTNAHVLEADEPPYKIETPDKQIHQAKVSKKANFGKYDLAILEFSSSKNYSIATIGTQPKIGDEVFIAGFPANEETVKNFTFTTGKIALVLEKALERGYQIGYTNQLEKGMSGGALLNKQGELIGVNGMHAYPIWDTPSVFIDGKPATETLHQQIVRLSWAVAIEKLNLSPPRSQSPTGNAERESLTHNNIIEAEPQI